MQRIGRRLSKLLSPLPPLVGIQFLRLALDVVQHAEQLERFLGDLALVVGPQIVKLASGVRQAPGFGNTLSEQGLVAAEVVAHQRALPLAQEGTRMLAGTRFGEVERKRSAKYVPSADLT